MTWYRMPPEAEFLPEAERRRIRDRLRKQAQRRGERSPRLDPVEVRLLRNLDRVNGFAPAHAPELGPCWVWTGGVASTGYGRIRVGGRSHDVHRLALRIALGRPIRPGMFACHRCDNKLCARPRHLYEGTPGENVRDVWERIRRPLSGGHQAYVIEAGS